MHAAQWLTRQLREHRPVLRVQLTLLYSGLFLGLLTAVLLAAGLLYGHSAQRAPAGTAPVNGDGGRTFDLGPALIGLAAAVLAVLGAWWLAGRFLRPLRTMTTTAQEISASNLSKRLELPSSGDELAALGGTLNDLFARLEATFTAQRNFVANASHELRTPLAGQRTLLQVALADPEGDITSLRAACEEALQLGTEQEILIDALLTLAGSEQGIQTRTRLDLAAIADSVINRRIPAADQSVTIDHRLHPAPTTGDPVLIERLLANVVDNALRYNQPDGTVTVATEMTNGRARLVVSNTGPTVTAEELTRLFQPFQQASTHRHHHGGHGLGLAIVRAIADAHGADLTARAHPDGGLTIELTLPG